MQSLWELCVIFHDSVFLADVPTQIRRLTIDFVKHIKPESYSGSMVVESFIEQCESADTLQKMSDVWTTLEVRMLLVFEMG